MRYSYSLSVLCMVPLFFLRADHPGTGSDRLFFYECNHYTFLTKPIIFELSSTLIIILVSCALIENLKHYRYSNDFNKMTLNKVYIKVHMYALYMYLLHHSFQWWVRNYEHLMQKWMLTMMQQNIYIRNNAGVLCVYKVHSMLCMYLFYYSLQSLVY